LNRTNGLKLFYRIHHWKNWVQLIRDEAIKRCLARLLLRSWGRFGGATIGLLQNDIDSSAFFTEKLLL
jgi:hypothetical protein